MTAKKFMIINLINGKDVIGTVAEDSKDGILLENPMRILRHIAENGAPAINLERYSLGAGDVLFMKHTIISYDHNFDNVLIDLYDIKLSLYHEWLDQELKTLMKEANNTYKALMTEDGQLDLTQFENLMGDDDEIQFDTIPSDPKNKLH